MFKRLRLGTKLTLVVALSVVGLLLASTLSIFALREVGINGRRYREISAIQELKADVLPPPLYLVESYTTAFVLAGAEQFQIPDLVNRMRFLRTEYLDRLDHWQKRVDPTSDIGIELANSARPAQAFWTIINEQFIAAVEEGNPAGVASALAALSAPFAEHRAIVDRLVVLVEHQQDTLENRASNFARVAFTALFVFTALLAVGTFLLSSVLVRSIRRPVRMLTEAATAAAQRELPALVERIEASPADEPLPQPEAIAIETDDELGQLAAAMNQIRATALDLAARQASSRRNVQEMFVNLGRRNQSLVNRQLSFIDELERSEENPETLEDLYRLDHLATRMRRNAESLLVLAGSEGTRHVKENAEIIDLMRAALSEVEDYQQVDIQSVDNARIKGAAVADIVHLLAELIENATAFSPPTATVNVVGRRSPTGYVISIVDEGIGMSPDQVIDANRRIEELDRFDVSPSKVLGLYVVGRLAARSGISVKLMESSVNGVTARVVLPLELLADVSTKESLPAVPQRLQPMVPSFQEPGLGQR